MKAKRVTQPSTTVTVWRAWASNPDDGGPTTIHWSEVPTMMPSQVGLLNYLATHPPEHGERRASSVLVDIDPPLTERESEVLWRRYNRETLATVARDMGITINRVRQLEAKAWRKVQASSNPPPARSSDGSAGT